MWLINDPSTLRYFFHNISTQIVTKSSQGAPIHPALLAFTVAAFTMGCLFGTLLIAPLADTFGRKGILLVNDIITVISTILLAGSKSVRAHGLFALARFVSGMCSGIFSCAVPLYLGEVAPTNLRGSLSILPMMFVSVGVLMSQILGRPDFLGNKKGLPFLLSCTAIMALFQLVLLLPFPESPRYLLIQQKNEDGARQALQKLRARLDVEEEIIELCQEDRYEKKEKHMTTFKLLCSPRHRWQLNCVVTLLMVQQFSGINAAYYYTEKVLATMNIDEKNVRYLTALLTFLLLFAHGVSVYYVDSWGRRPLLLIGSGVCIISCVLLTMSLELQVCSTKSEA
ncbi:hypothetical protein lerEdw1_021201 [Lerista edwardsae]|nr:hypothetical protein lerEdw1_021202 [Lerista edwardsae]KAJ6651202.1 hypothetical protein lerEdw1_021201 [Lerista edwardsae]